MEIRRKVFSLIQNESGEERLFSTNEFSLQTQEDEKLFSTGDEELDNILAEVYYSGLEDGYNYFSYEQREFNKRKHNQRQNILKSQVQATGKSSQLVDDAGRITKVAAEIKEKYNGDIDKWLKSLKEDSERRNEYKKYNGMFKSGSQRESLEQALKGTDASKTKVVEKAAHSAETAVERGADATVAYGKDRQSVQTRGGNTFKAGGKKVNVSADNTGSVKVKTAAGAKEGDRVTLTESKSSNRRANVVNREVSNPPQNNTKIGKNRRGSVNSKYKKNQNVPVRQTAPIDQVFIGSSGNTKRNISTISNGKVNRANTNSLGKNGNILNTTIENGITTTNGTTGRKSLMNRAGSWLKNNKGKAALIGAGLVATGAGIGLAANRNRRKEEPAGQRQFAENQEAEKKPNNKGLNAGLAAAGATTAAGAGLAGYSIAKTKKNYKNFIANDAKAAELAKSGKLNLSRMGNIHGKGFGPNGGISKAMEFAKNNKGLYRAGSAGITAAGVGLLATGGLLAAKKIKNDK